MTDIDFKIINPNDERLDIIQKLYDKGYTSVRVFAIFSDEESSYSIVDESGFECNLESLRKLLTEVSIRSNSVLLNSR
jgi:hypothetical protein